MISIVSITFNFSQQKFLACLKRLFDEKRLQANKNHSFSANGTRDPRTECSYQSFFLRLCQVVTQILHNQFSSSESRQSINFKISPKHLDYTSSSKPCSKFKQHFSFKNMTKLQPRYLDQTSASNSRPICRQYISQHQHQ